MGTLFRGVPNSKGNGRQKGTKGGCTAANLFLPPIFRTAIRSTLPLRPMEIMESDLHPASVALLDDLAAGRSSSFNYTNSSGHRIATQFNEPANSDGDLRAGLSLSINESEAFGGTLSVATYFRRGRVAAAHCAVGIVEVLYDELYQAAKIGHSKIVLQMGLVEISGDMSNGELVLAAFRSFYDLKRRDGEPGLDCTLYYGFYPDLGFEYFYSNDYRVVE